MLSNAEEFHELDGWLRDTARDMWILKMEGAQLCSQLHDEQVIRFQLEYNCILSDFIDKISADCEVF